MYFEAQVEKELRPIQFFKHSKEMEMNFRRVLTALACLTLFAGLASAQFPQLATINCTVQAVATPNIATEGVTEKVGDLLITCGNSTTAPVNQTAVDRGQLLIDFGTAITSNAAANVANVGKPSEILMLNNEPGIGAGPVAGYGQNAAISVCTSAQSQADQAAVIAGNTLGAPANCPAYIYNVNTLGAITLGGAFWVLDSNGLGVLAGQAKNAYQGAIGGSAGIGFTANQVMFYDVPILPSGSGSLTNKFRIVNARVNPGSLATITATLTPTPLSISGNPIIGARWQYAFTPTSASVANAAASMTITTRSLGAVSLCTSSALAPGATQAKANLSLVTFRENWAGAWKTRNLPLTAGGATAGDAWAGGATQVRPDGVYSVAPVAPSTTTLNLSALNSATGVYVAGVVANGLNYGQATTGTRLKAIFANLDPNVTYYVSRFPVIDYSTPLTMGTNVVTATVTGLAGDATQNAWATLLSGGTGAVAVNETAAYALAASAAFANTTIDVATVNRLTAAAGSVPAGGGEVVWEVTNINPSAAQSLTFALYAVYSNTVNPPTATSTVQIGYAPTSSSTAPGNTTNIPRNIALTSGATSTLFSVVPCQTVLMFPYVTNVTGYETGMAISNTSKDPFQTQQSSGACSMYFYGQNQPSAAVAFVNGAGASTIAAGEMSANTASGLGLVNFNGYGLAVCNFQFAHGFAFVQNRTQTVGMGYLPLVMDTSTNQIATRGQTLLGESFKN